VKFGNASENCNIERQSDVIKVFGANRAIIAVNEPPVKLNFKFRKKFFGQFFGRAMSEK
jgi:hypothetical protein